MKIFVYDYDVLGLFIMVFSLKDLLPKEHKSFTTLQCFFTSKPLTFSPNSQFLYLLPTHSDKMMLSVCKHRSARLFMHVCISHDTTFVA